MGNSQKTKIDDDENGSGGSSNEILAATIKEAYTDLVQPAAIQAGFTLETMAMLVNALSLPIRAVAVLLSTALRERLKNVPRNRRRASPQEIWVPAVLGLASKMEAPELQELFLNLLASSMDQDTADLVHPAYVNIVSQMTSYEAQLMKAFVDEPVWLLLRIEKWEGPQHESQLLSCQFAGLLPQMIEPASKYLRPGALENLERLGLLEKLQAEAGRMQAILQDTEVTSNLRDHPSMAEIIGQPGLIGGWTCIEVTAFGKQFLQACMRSANASVAART